MHRPPFLPLGRMNGREDQVILVLGAGTGEVRAGLGRVERQLGEEALAARIAGGDLLELQEVEQPDRGILVRQFQQRLIPASRPAERARPVARAGEVGQHRDQRLPALGPRRGRHAGQRRQRPRSLVHGVEHLAGDARADARQQLQHAEACDAVTRVLGPAQQRQHVLHMRRIEELQPAELDERDVAPRQLDLERPRMRRGAEQHRLVLEREAAFARLQHLLDHVQRLCRLVAHRHQLRLQARLPLGPQILGEALLGFGDHCIGGLEDRRGRAIIAVERDDVRGRREAGRKFQNVAHCRGTERVDRLRVVAHHRQARAIRLQRQQDRGLQSVGVLILIDQYMVEAAA